MTNILPYKSLSWISISTEIIFFGIQTTYYSTTLNFEQVGFSKTIHQVIFGDRQILGYIAAEFSIHGALRKKASIMAGASSGLCLLLLGIQVFLLENGDKHYILKLGISSKIGTISLYSLLILVYFLCLLLCNCFRSHGYGWTSVRNMIRSTLSPYVTTISAAIDLSSWLPPATIGLLSTLFIYKLP